MVLDSEALQTRHTEKRHALLKAAVRRMSELKRVHWRLL